MVCAWLSHDQLYRGVTNIGSVPFNIVFTSKTRGRIIINSLLSYEHLPNAQPCEDLEVGCRAQGTPTPSGFGPLQE